MNFTPNLSKNYPFFLLTACLFFSCKSPKKSESNIVLTTGTSLSILVDQFKSDTGNYPEDLKVAVDKYKEYTSSDIQLESWQFIREDTFYLIIHKIIINDKLYIFSNSARANVVKVDSD